VGYVSEHSSSPLAGVCLPDSWVLSVESEETRLTLVLDAVLDESHPRFYWPPSSGEQHAYARIRWQITGGVRWVDGPHLDQPAIDASGERDFGNVDGWWSEGATDYLEGSFGTVAIHNPTHEVAMLNRA
jgi:hypothetical protein